MSGLTACGLTGLQGLQRIGEECSTGRKADGAKDSEGWIEGKLDDSRL